MTDSVSPAAEEVAWLRKQVEWLERNSVLRSPASATIADYLAVRESGKWETPCPARDDKKHCNCWYDGKPCCSCGDDAAQENLATLEAGRTGE